MFRFLRIERPITLTCRPTSTATSIACCMRWMFEANDEISTRPCRAGMICRNASPTTRSDSVTPARSAFVESPSSRSTPRLPSSASLPTSVRRPSIGVWSSFQSPRVEDAAGGGLERDADRVGHRVRHPDELGAERAELERRRVRIDLAQSRRLQQAVLVELRLDEAERQARREDLAHAHLAEEVRQRADVILVRVREDHRAHVAVSQVAEVGQDQVDAEVLVAREGESGVDDDRLAGDLEHGHVLADLAEPAERDHT